MAEDVIVAVVEEEVEARFEDAIRKLKKTKERSHLINW